MAILPSPTKHVLVANQSLNIFICICCPVTLYELFQL